MSTTLVNGVVATGVPVDDRGLHYGDGLFETLAVRHGIPLLWERHMARLRTGATRLAMAPPDETVLRAEAGQLSAGMARAVLKIIWTRGSGPRGYSPEGAGPPTRVLRIFPWPDYASACATEGVGVRLCRTRLSEQPALAGLKHLNRLEQVLARAEWRDEYAEGLMLNARDQVIAGTMSNVFVVAGGVLYTPELALCGIVGIMRNLVLEHAVRLELPCRVAPLTLDSVRAADEVFLTNSLIGIWPVRQFEQRKYRMGSVARTLQQVIEDAQNAT